MIIKGLSSYNITDRNGKLEVRNLKTGRLLKLLETTTSPHYTIRVDSDTPMYKCFSPGFLRFLMKNPETDARTIAPAKDRIKFTNDGKIIGLYDCKGRKKPYNSFADIDDALSTIVIMKAASAGDMHFVYNFIMENREKAVIKVAHLEDASINKVNLYCAEGEELFIHQLRTASCQHIIPLFPWLCKCVRIAYLDHKRRFVEITKIKGI